MRWAISKEIKDNQRKSSEVMRNQMISKAIVGHHIKSKEIKGNQRKSKQTKGTLMSLDTCKLMVPWCRSTRVKHNTNVECIPSLGITCVTLVSPRTLSSYHPSASLVVPWCRLNACKTQHKRWMYTIPRHHLCYPGVASMRVTHNTNVEIIPSLGITYGTLILPQCMQNTIQTLSLYHPSASLMVPWCRLYACKTQYKCWVYTIPRHHSWYPDVASMHVKHNTHVEFIQSLGITYGTLMSPQCI